MVQLWSRTVPINYWNPAFYKITLRLECPSHISVIKADFAPLNTGRLKIQSATRWTSRANTAPTQGTRGCGRGGQTLRESG